MPRPPTNHHYLTHIKTNRERAHKREWQGEERRKHNRGWFKWKIMWYYHREREIKREGVRKRKKWTEKRERESKKISWNKTNSCPRSCSSAVPLTAKSNSALWATIWAGSCCVFMCVCVRSWLCLCLHWCVYLCRAAWCETPLGQWSVWWWCAGDVCIYS